MLPFKTILFATDFSPASKVAFEVASALARDYRAHIVAVHVVEPVAVAFTEYTAYIGPEEDMEKVTEMLHALEAPWPNVTLEHRILEGSAPSVITETAEEIGADLIVMGTHGRTGFTRLIMGSVAEEVLRRAPCPVLTIRATADVGVEEDVPEAMSI